MIGALPHWPQLMTREMAAAYLSVGETQLAALTARYRIAAVDLTPCRGVLWRKADLDRLVDMLPGRGEGSSPETVLMAVDTDADMLARLERRGRRGKR